MHDKWQELAKTLLGPVKRFDYPNIFNGRKYEVYIPWLGNIILVSALSGDATHKQLERGLRHSNKQGESALEQV